MPQFTGRVFLDASVIFSGCHSPGGGSAVVLDACIAGLLTPVASPIVIDEAHNSLVMKSNKEAIKRFTSLIQHSGLDLLKTPSSAEIKRYEKIIHSKDAHVLAAASKSNCRFLLTLDRKHFFTPELRKADLPFQIATPGEFLEILTNMNFSD